MGRRKGSKAKARKASRDAFDFDKTDKKNSAKNPSAVIKKTESGGGDHEAIGTKALTWNDVMQILPKNEVRDRVFKRLDLEDKLTARTVCKLWKEYVDDTLVLCPLLYDGSAEDVLELGSKGGDVRKLTTSKLLDFEYPAGGLGFRHVENIRLIPYRDDVYHWDIETSRAFGISDKNLKALLTNYPDVEGLSVHSRALFNVENRPSLLQTARLYNLKKFELSTYNGDGYGYEVATDVFQNIFPNLKEMNVCVINQEENDVHVPLLYEECYRFIGAHAGSLEKINLNHCNCFDERRLMWFELFLDLNIPEPAYVDILEKLDKVNVSELEFGLTYYEGRSRFNFGIRLMTAQTNLVKLVINRLSYANVAMWDAVPGVLKKCSRTLKEVVLQGCLCGPGPDHPPFSCTSVKACHKLTTLSIQVCGPRMAYINDIPKQVKVLALGQRLTRRQIEYIGNNFGNLEKLTLEQGGVLSEGSLFPKVSLKIFKQLITLKRLGQLELNKRTCDINRIRAFIARWRGLEEIKECDDDDDEEEEEEVARNTIRIRIDHNAMYRT